MSALSTARYRASIAPLPSAEARQWWSPASMMTAPRLRAFEPEVTVQRASWTGGGVALVGSGIRSTSGSRWRGRRPAGTADDVVVKCRSSRRRSSAPDFQIAYSSESARADAEAAMMFVSEPMVDQVRAPSCESMMTRVRAAVAASPSRMRTL